MKENFGKKFKLCSKTQIDQVFDSGIRVSQFPFQILFQSTSFLENIPFKVLISIPKKKIKKAVKRNYLKRLIREIIRKNKLHLETFLIENKIQLAICVIYSTSEEMNYLDLEAKISKAFNKIINHVSEQNNEKKG